MIFSKRVQITSPKGFFNFGCGAILIGLILLVLAFISYNNEQGFLKTAKHASGTVVDFVESVRTNNNTNNSSPPGIMYYPIINFIANGHDYTITSNEGTNPPQYQQGQSVDVIYDPENPFNAKINSWINDWFAGIILVVMGVLFTLVGILLIIFRHKIKANKMINPPPFQNFN